MHVARLQIAGVRGFYGDRSVDLDLTRPDGSLAGWTVLAGRNGSGKSTILQALALALAGPRSTAFVPSLADWMSRGITHAEIRAVLRSSEADNIRQQLLLVEESEVWMKFSRPAAMEGVEELEPDFEGYGVSALADSPAVGGRSYGWFYAGYGPFRHLGNTVTRRLGSSRSSKVAQQVASLFDETVPLADAVDWLVEQHLYQLEKRRGADQLMHVMTTLLSDGLLPDGFEVRRVDSDGLWVRNQHSEFPLRDMSDGYRAVTALVVDIVRQMYAAYPDLTLDKRSGIPTLPYPGVILIDEVDAHLHVSWQQKIGTWLKEHFPEIQFIVTTHSPYICQSADPGGLILLPSPGEHRPPRIADQDLYQRVVYGSGDDAILSELFGVETPYSPAAERMRQRLGDLEIRVLEGTASAAEKEEYRALSETLTSSLTARVDEVAARFRRDG
jgi:AAA domain, putative AbiEii toxin, Type IV TA system/AAA domain